MWSEYNELCWIDIDYSLPQTYEKKTLRENLTTFLDADVKAQRVFLLLILWSVLSHLISQISYTEISTE